MRAIGRLLTGTSLFVLAVALGIATTLALMAYLSGTEPGGGSGDGGTTAPPEGRPVVVMIEDVPAGTRLTEGMVETRSVPDAQRLGGVFEDVADVVGRTTRYPLMRNEQVVGSKLVGADGPAGTGLAFSVPPGMRAVSIPISALSTAGGLVVPGDRVDILVSTTSHKLLDPVERQTTDETDDPVVVTLLQDVMVLAIAQTITPPIEPDRDPSTLRAENAAPNPGAGTATVAVTPEQAQLLFMATQQGALGLALRPYGEDTVDTLRPRFKLEPIYESITGLAMNPEDER